MYCGSFFLFFFFNDTATTEIYTLSLHDALPILTLMPYFAGSVTLTMVRGKLPCSSRCARSARNVGWRSAPSGAVTRSEEHTSELQSRLHLVCRLLLEKKKKQ